MYATHKLSPQKTNKKTLRGAVLWSVRWDSNLQAAENLLILRRLHFDTCSLDNPLFHAVWTNILSAPRHGASTWAIPSVKCMRSGENGPDVSMQAWIFIYCLTQLLPCKRPAAWKKRRLSDSEGSREVSVFPVHPYLKASPPRTGRFFVFF